jgi:lysophospholipase L1-like esterase
MSGSTTVMCTATDARQRLASCSFSVTVTLPPRISATRFVAFGDSITEGLPRSIRPTLLIPSPPGSYPAQLQTLLTERYTAQVEVIAVLDEGIGGETVDAGIRRLPDVLAADAPGALLLMEGVNDLNAFGSAAIQPVVDGLRTMIRLARGRGIPVFVGTLLPQRAGGEKAGAVNLIVPANDAIRPMVVAEGATLVDLYQAFGGTPDPWISSDGLHTTDQGNKRIAETFFDAIRARFEASTGVPGVAWYR